MKRISEILILLLLFNTTSINANTIEDSFDNYEVLPDTFIWTTANISTYSDTTLIIRYDFDLNSQTIVLPSNVTLSFEGGSLTNGTLEGNYTSIEAPLTKIFETSITLTETFLYDTFYPEWFGAKGNLIDDDYEAINTTFQNASHVTLTQKYLVATDNQIKVNRGGNFTLMGYGSLISNNTQNHLDEPVFEFKNIDNLVIKGIEINGNFKIAQALSIDDIDVVTLKDIIIKELLNTNSGLRAVGIRIEINNASLVYGDNIKISQIAGGQNGVIDSGVGVARALYCVINYDDVEEEDAGPGPNDNIVGTAHEKTRVVFENSDFEWVYGDDGDVIDIIDQDYISNAEHRFIFRNCNIKYASRRLVKGSASGIQYYNCTFDTASVTDLTSKMNGIAPQPSGGVNFRNANSATYDKFRNMHGKMIDCVYKDTGNLSIGSGDQLIVSNVDGLEVRNTRFYDSKLKLQTLVGNVLINNNTFYNSHIEIGVGNWDTDRSYITNNTAYYKAPIIPFAFINVTTNLTSLTIDSNKIFSDEQYRDENGDIVYDTNYFGLLRHVTSGIASKVYVSRNEIIRTNNPSGRRELFISTRDWDGTCLIYDNINSVISQYAGPNFTSAAIFSGRDWNNRDGKGDVTITLGSN